MLDEILSSLPQSHAITDGGVNGYKSVRRVVMDMVEQLYSANKSTIP